MTTGVKLTLYCEHVNSSHVHCNRTTTVTVKDISKSFRERIEETAWTVENGEIRCFEHA